MVSVSTGYRFHNPSVAPLAGQDTAAPCRTRRDTFPMPCAAEAPVSQDLAILYQVQLLDTEIAALRQALAGLDTGAELEAEIAAAEVERTSLLSRHHATEAEAKDRDLALKTLEEKRAKFKSQLYSGTVCNPRQLTDLESEVQMLSREIGKIEDRMLELMEAVESERAELKEREARLAEMRARLAEVQERYASTSGRLRAETAEVEGKRTSV